MSHSEKYNFSDFTQTHYRFLLESMKAKHVIRSFTDFKEDEDFCIVRHDIDLSLDSALEIARIEVEADIRSTYFLHFHSEWYNLMEARSARCVETLLELGHHIALHFDAEYYGITSLDQFESRLGEEKEWLGQVFGMTPEVFSFHNPSEYMLGFDEMRYVGMLNTYARYFRTEVGYCSDSNGFWRHARMADFLEAHEHPRIQILTHPAWWSKKVDSPSQKVIHHAQERADETIRLYEQMLRAHDRLNIDWD